MGLKSVRSERVESGTFCASLGVGVYGSGAVVQLCLGEPVAITTLSCPCCGAAFSASRGDVMRIMLQRPDAAAPMSNAPALLMAYSVSMNLVEVRSGECSCVRTRHVLSAKIDPLLILAIKERPVVPSPGESGEISPEFSVNNCMIESSLCGVVSGSAVLSWAARVRPPCVRRAGQSLSRCFPS